MRGKRLLSLAVSASVSVSALAGLTIGAGTGASAELIRETDFIGSSSAAETFDSYSYSDEWSYEGYSDGNNLQSIFSVTGVEKPELGAAVSSSTDESGSTVYDFPTYVSGKAFGVQARNKHSNSSKLTFHKTVSNGILYFNTDIGYYSEASPYATYGDKVYFYDSNGNTVLSANLPALGAHAGSFGITGTETVTTEKQVERRSQYDGLGISAVIDLDANTAEVTFDFVATDKARCQEKLTVDIADTDIAGLALTATVDANSTNIRTMIDNTQLYAVQTFSSDTNESYIGTKTNAETYAAYDASGWTCSTDSNNKFGTGIVDVTEIAKPSVGNEASYTVSTDGEGNETRTYTYPTYVSGETLAVGHKGSGTQTAKYMLDEPRYAGTVYLKTDVGFRSSFVYRGGTVCLCDLNGDSVLKVNIPSSKSSSLSVVGKTTATTENNFSTRKVGANETDGLHIGTMLDIDTGLAKVTLDFIGTDNIRYSETMTVEVDNREIAGLTVSVNSESSQWNYTMLDNTQFYALAPSDATPAPEPTTEDEADEYADADEPKALRITYKNEDGYIVKTQKIDVSGWAEGSEYTYYVGAYIIGFDGILYKSPSNYSRKAVLQNGSTIVYETVSQYTSGRYYFADFDTSAAGGHRDQASNGGVALASGLAGRTLLTVGKSGYYTVICAGQNTRNAQTYSNGALSADGNVILDGVTSYSTERIVTAENVYIENGAQITLRAVPQTSEGSTSYAGIDYILLVRTGSKSTAVSGEAGVYYMENLDRGLFATRNASGNGIYLSWRLLGTESVSDQAFDIYKNGTKLATTGAAAATNYVDASGTASDSYIVVRAGETINGKTAVTPYGTAEYFNGNSKYYGTSDSYFDIPLISPPPATPAPDMNGGTSDTAAEYSANDASVGDLDGDGQYEIVLKWHPDNAKDNSTSGLTSAEKYQAYEIDPNGNGRGIWQQPIDLGPNIRSGAHYSQFIVYDLDGDGKAEVAMQTAPGSKDGQGNYVTAAGDTATIRKADNTANYRNSGGYILTGPEYLTIFDGATGKALCTTDYIERGKVSDWGDSYGNRVDRMLATVAYLNGSTPSLIFSRGYYARAKMAAYDWDGVSLTRRWYNESTSLTSCTVTNADGTVTNQTAAKAGGGNGSIYGQGNHSLAVCDADGDGKDEIVFGSAVVDDDGLVLNNTGHGHGDALHVSDFNNDGAQEIYQVHETPSESAKGYASELRKAANGTVIGGQGASIDNGRGVMDNFADDPETLSQYYSSGFAPTYRYPETETARADNSYGDNDATDVVMSGNTGFYNSMLYWDGDLAREMLDSNKLCKMTYDSSTKTFGSKRIIWKNTSFFNGSANNSSKANACLSADILGDWREEVIFKATDGSGNPVLRVYVPTAVTEYRIPTLMHDPQYREGVATENVGYNQPPHTSYYIGKASLAAGQKYLAPASQFKTVRTDTFKTGGIAEDDDDFSYDAEDPGYAVNVARNENVTGINEGYHDVTFTNTVTVPAGESIDGGSITVTIAGIEAVKNDTFEEKLAAITGASFEFTAGITNVPDGETVEGKCVTALVINNVTKELVNDSAEID